MLHTGSVSSLCGGVCSQGSTRVLVFSVSGRSHAPHGGAHQDTLSNEAKAKPHRAEGLVKVTTAADAKAKSPNSYLRYLNLALDYEL